MDLQLDNFYKLLQRGGNRRSKFNLFRGGKGGSGALADGDFTVDDMLLYSPVWSHKACHA